MKTNRKLLLLIATSLLLAGGQQGIKVLSHNQGRYEPVLMENIEALSQDEITKPWVYPDGIETGRFECGAKLSTGKKCSFQVVTCGGGGKGCNPRPCNFHG